jgi:hypothetical protein
VFDHQQRERGFRWLRQEEIEGNKQQFEASLTGLKKGEQNKRRKEYAANATHFTGKKIQPRPAFFQTEIRDSIMCCHPDDIQILTQTLEG